MPAIYFILIFIKKPIKQIHIWQILCHQGKDIALKPSSANWNLEGVELPLDRESRFFRDEDFVVFLFQLCLVQKQDSFPK